MMILLSMSAMIGACFMGLYSKIDGIEDKVDEIKRKAEKEQ